LIGIAQDQVKTLGYFQTITVDLLFPLMFHVVPCKALTVNVILGTDFISQAEIKIDQNGININKPNASIFLANIELQPDKEDDAIHTPVTIERVLKTL